ncbi:MAG: hypothetical protein R2753_14235 [Chitinophagales bacterium]
MPPRADELKKYVAKHFSDHQVYSAYEAGCCGYAAHRSFKTYGWNSIVVNPADIPRHKSKPVKRRIKLMLLISVVSYETDNYEVFTFRIKKARTIAKFI